MEDVTVVKIVESPSGSHTGIAFNMVFEARSPRSEASVTVYINREIELYLDLDREPSTFFKPISITINMSMKFGFCIFVMCRSKDKTGHCMNFR